MRYLITRPIIRLLMKPFIAGMEGMQNIPAKGGVIFAANHASYLDHFIIGIAVSKKRREDTHTLAKKEHFARFFERMWHQYLNAIPIDRETGGKDALNEAITLLKKGHAIWIYPEGTRTLTGSMNRAKTGVARLALEAHVPVIPIGLTNTFWIMPKGRHFPKFGRKAYLKVGKPLTFKAHYKMKEDKMALRKVTTRIMKKIANLSNQEYPFDEDLA